MVVIHVYTTCVMSDLMEQSSSDQLTLSVWKLRQNSIIRLSINRNRELVRRKFICTTRARGAICKAHIRRQLMLVVVPVWAAAIEG
jgi:hypothetical protein